MSSNVPVRIYYIHNLDRDMVEDLMKLNDPLPAEPCENVNVCQDLVELLLRDGEQLKHAHGQQFVTTANGRLLIIVPGASVVYDIDPTAGHHATIYVRRLIMITHRNIVIDRGAIPNSLPYASTILLGPFMYSAQMVTLTKRYIDANSSDRYYTLPRKDPPIVTIFHAGFPDVRPAIVPATKFITHARARLQSDDGNFTVTTTVALTESDVETFERSFDLVKPCVYSDAVLTIFAELLIGSKSVCAIVRG